MLGQSSELQQHKIQNMIFALPEPEILSYLLITTSNNDSREWAMVTGWSRSGLTMA